MEHGIPFFSPTLVGCALAVDRTYFDHIGAFDEDLKVWGGENIELAFRTWMCGGRVITVPCSRVGHVFKNFPYKFDGDKDTIVQKNLMRVAETWMDGMKKYFYAATRVYDFKRVEFDSQELKSLQKRKELRKQLRCNSFEWYMHDIIPEIEPPAMDSVYYGEIMNLKTRACFEPTFEQEYIGMSYYCYEHKIIPRNYFRIDIYGLLRYRDRCVHINPPDPILTIVECPKPGSDLTHFGTWDLKNMGHTWGQIRVKMKNDKGVQVYWCIMQVTNVMDAHKGEQMPQIATCDDNNQFQIWSFTYKFFFES